MQLFGHNRYELKIAEGFHPLFWGGAGSPSNTKSPELRPIYSGVDNWLITVNQPTVIGYEKIC